MIFPPLCTCHGSQGHALSGCGVRPGIRGTNLQGRWEWQPPQLVISLWSQPGLHAVMALGGGTWGLPKRLTQVFWILALSCGGEPLDSFCGESQR